MESEWKWVGGEWEHDNGIVITGETDDGLYLTYGTCGDGGMRPHYYMPQTQAFIGIPPGWTCAYCNASLPSDRDKCPNCGGPRHETNA